MLENVEVLCHSSIRIVKEKTIYIDPFRTEKEYNDADVIFITHDHWDHYSEEDINKVRKEATVIVIPKDIKNKAMENGFEEGNICIVEPDREYEVAGIKFETVPAYNTNKKFHPKEIGWIGYIVELDAARYYIAGDTDINESNKKVKCDVALVPVGGTYTMTAKEAAELINEIKPKVAVPTHYGAIVGEKENGLEFVELLNPEINGIILIK